MVSMSTDKRGATHDQPSRSATVGVVLMGLSLFLWIGLLIVPFLPLTAGVKATTAGSLVIIAEVAFWGGAALAGPAAARRMKSWWRTRLT